MKPRVVATLVFCLSSLHAMAVWADDPPAADEPAAPEPAKPEPARPPEPPMHTDDVKPSVSDAMGAHSEIVVTGGSMRGTAEEFLVLPDGGEVGGKLRTIMADGGLGTGQLKLTDVALFDLNAQWAIAHHYELDASISFLPKQPSSTHENIFQGGSLALRRDLWARTALALSAGAGPLLDLKGLTFGGSAFITHKKRLNEIVTFALAGGASTTVIRPTVGTRPYLIEGAGHAAILVRIPNGVWGGWMGAGYAVPAYHRGHDPVSGMLIDPQPRLDLELGTAVQLADHWDLSIELTILDRGDLTNPATRLPVLDGGFDQIQFVVGVSRRIESSKSRRDRGITDPLIQL